MNHIRRSIGLSSCALLNSCHPERSLAKSEANRQTQSKDLVLAEGSTGDEGNFRIVVRFLDEHDGEVHHEPSGEAAKECSPRRKPWVASASLIKPRRGKRSSSGNPLDETTTL